MNRMMLFAGFLLSLLLTAMAPARADDACLAWLKKVDSKQTELSRKELAEFFQGFRPACLDGEYGEWSNELLFSVLSRQPGDFAEVLQLQDSAGRNRILAMLESPVNDGIDLAAIHAKVVKSAKASPLKSRMVRALRVAASKSGLRLD